MIDELYKVRLSGWVKLERDRLKRKDKPLSFSQLEKTILRATGGVIDRGTLIKWEAGTIARELVGEPLQVLAAYRGESIDECRRWLEGKGEETEKAEISEVEIIRWIQYCKNLGKLARLASKVTDRMAELTDGG